MLKFTYYRLCGMAFTYTNLHATPYTQKIMQQFHFDTGVKPHNRPNGLCEGQIWLNGTMQIPFKANVPENAIFKFASDNPELYPGSYLVAELFETTLASKYGYFIVPLSTLDESTEHD